LSEHNILDSEEEEMKRLLIFVFSAILCIPTASLSQNVSDYLVLQDIGAYKLDRPEKVFAGEPPIGGPRSYDNWSGILAATGHFPDHVDKAYEVMYIGGGGLPSPTVQVTQHSGSDSDKWLLHEVDRDFRTYYGIPGEIYGPRQIDGQTILEAFAGGGNYRWLSGNKVIMIEYQDSQLTKPEPLEIVRAYLAKHPSSLSPMSLAQLRSSENKTKWIKDEMERRLWLCDKWETQFQLGKVQQKDMLQEQVKSMEVFLNYREKYYGMKAADEKNLLNGYLSQNNRAAIRNKLDEYKQWWSANKTKAISL
jgi:hypothetical protein